MRSFAIDGGSKIKDVCPHELDLVFGTLLCRLFDFYWPICMIRRLRIHQVCARQAGHRPLTCLTDTPKKTQMAIVMRNRQEFRWTDVWDSRENGSVER